MGVRESVFSRATSGHAGLSGLIGTRCYPKRLPDNVTLPAVRYRIVSTPTAPEYTDHDGSSRWPYRIQLDGYADTPDEVDDLGDQMFDAFHAWSNGSAVGFSFVMNRQNNDELELNMHRETLDILIDHIL